MSTPDATDRDTAAGVEAALLSLWREAAEKGIEHGIAWPHIVRDLFKVLDRAASDRATAKAEALREAAEHFRGLHTGADMQSDQGRRVYVDSLQMGKFLDWLDGHAAARIARTP